MTDEVKYKIILQDEVVFELEDSVVNHIPKLKEIFSNTLIKEAILNNIDPRSFSHILTIIKYRNANPDDNEFPKIIIDSIKPESLFDFIIVADFLKTEDLLKQASDRFKNIIEKNNVNEIRNIFNLLDDID